MAENDHPAVYKLIMEKAIYKTHGYHYIYTNENTPFHLAAQNGNLLCCKEIMNNIHKRSPTNNKLETPLHTHGCKKWSPPSTSIDNKSNPEKTSRHKGMVPNSKFKIKNVYEKYRFSRFQLIRGDKRMLIQKLFQPIMI